MLASTLRPLLSLSKGLSKGAGKKRGSVMQKQLCKP
jgi:hypothetical protein